MKLVKILLILPYIFLFIGCSKYEDGPVISLNLKKARLTNVWKIENYTVDGTVKSFCSQCKVEFTSDGKEIRTEYLNGSSSIHEGTWEFVTNKEEIKVINGSIITVYKILRLKSKELWLQCNQISGYVEEYHYIPF